MGDQLDKAIEFSPAEGLPAGALWSTAYEDLKQLARARLRRSGRNTLLDTTALVNEAFTRLAGSARLRLEHRSQFFAYSARVMHSVTIAAPGRAISQTGPSCIGYHLSARGELADEPHQPARGSAAELACSLIR